MPSVENLQFVVSWVLLSACVLTMILAIRETKGIPLREIFAIRDRGNVPRGFHLFSGLFSVFVALYGVNNANYSPACFMLLVAMLQFWQYGLAENNQEANVNEI